MKETIERFFQVVILAAENSDAFWKFYKQNEESIAAEEETIVRWFVFRFLII
jgi:hypothetical protein